jgi:hypothetical protein
MSRPALGTMQHFCGPGFRSAPQRSSKITRRGMDRPLLESTPGYGSWEAPFVSMLSGESWGLIPHVNRQHAATSVLTRAPSSEQRLVGSWQHQIAGVRGRRTRLPLSSRTTQRLVSREKCGEPEMTRWRHAMEMDGGCSEEHDPSRTRTLPS